VILIGQNTSFGLQSAKQRLRYGSITQPLMSALQMGLPPGNYFVVSEDIFNQTGPLDVTFK
jgi:hypothetical protein